MQCRLFNDHAPFRKPATLPVICVVVAVAGRGVDVVCNQPVEVLVATYANALHFLLGDVQAVRVEVAQNHHVLEHRGGTTFSTQDVTGYWIHNLIR